MISVLEAMKVYQGLYDCTDFILNTAYHISLEAQSAILDQGIRGWADILACNPEAYLRPNRIMNSTLARGLFLKEPELNLRATAGFVAAQVPDLTSLGGPNQVGSESVSSNLSYQCSGDEAIVGTMMGEPFRGAGMDLQGDVSANMLIPRNSSTEMLLMDPDLVLQNLLDACYRWNSVEQC